MWLWSTMRLQVVVWESAGGRGSNDRNLPKKTSKKRVDMLTEMIHSHISMSKKNTDPIHMILILYGISEAMQPVASQTP